MNWLREKLVKWLDIQQDYSRKVYQDIAVGNLRRVRTLEKLVKIGVDIHQKSPSWAVVCIEGHPEYIKFYGADTNTIKEIKNFLKQFNNSDTIIDAPISLDKRYFSGDY